MVQTNPLREYLLREYVFDEAGRLLRRHDYKQWKARREVGTVSQRGYKTLSIAGYRYYVHRLIYLMHYGELPELVDHKNGDKLDNRPSNLRESTKVNNALNLHQCHKDNISGFLGVTYRKDTGKYAARFRNKNLGCFATPEEAHEVYEQAKLSGDEEVTPGGTEGPVSED
jgi:hypothetical protein